MDMSKTNNQQTIQCKAFIISDVECVNLPDDIEHKMRIMANLIIDRLLEKQETINQAKT